MIPDKQAAALKYLPGDFAPVLLCKGRGHLAEKLLEGALAADIPVVRDREALEGLMVLEPLEYIPEELFQAVAEILAFVYSLENGKRYENNQG